MLSTWGENDRKTILTRRGASRIFIKHEPEQRHRRFPDLQAIHAATTQLRPKLGAGPIHPVRDRLLMQVQHLRYSRVPWPRIAYWSPEEPKWAVGFAVGTSGPRGTSRLVLER